MYRANQRNCTIALKSFAYNVMFTSALAENVIALMSGIVPILMDFVIDWYSHDNSNFHDISYLLEL